MTDILFSSWGGVVTDNRGNLKQRDNLSPLSICPWNLIKREDQGLHRLGWDCRQRPRRRYGRFDSGLPGSGSEGILRKVHTLPRGDPGHGNHHESDCGGSGQG